KYLSIRPEPSKELESIEALRKELEAKSGKISELEEKITVIEARESEKEPYEKITTGLMNDPEMRGMIKKWLEKKAR
ncbi:MAG: hypothetical protein IMF19_16590, partial [Proteobacteria bacterium]|nr:hypothetical protein [Pseudomonadota bacterium]